MEMINFEMLEEEVEFVKKATKYFEENPKGRTYTKGDIEGDILFAVRWGIGDDCILVFRESDNVRIYENIIKEE